MSGRLIQHMGSKYRRGGLSLTQNAQGDIKKRSNWLNSINLDTSPIVF